MSDARTATMTSQTSPAAIAAVKTLNFPMNPLVSGIPAKESMKTANSVATSGDFFASPAHFDRCVASPLPSRTSVITANAPMVVKPYEMR